MAINDLKYLIRSISPSMAQIIILHLKSDVYFYGIFQKPDDSSDDKDYTFTVDVILGYERLAMDHGARKVGFNWRKNPVDAREFANLLTSIDGYKEMTEEQIENIIDGHVYNYEDILNFYENTTNEL